MTQRTLRSNLRRMAWYWPHAGIVIGFGLNAVGFAIGNSNLIGTASNLLAFCAFKLAQKRRKQP